MSDTCPQCGEEFESLGHHMGSSPSCELSEEVLIDELERLADGLGKTPSAPDMDEYGNFSKDTYRANFGSWNGALKAAGLELNKEWDIGEDKLLDELHRLADELGDTVGRRDMNEYGKFSEGPYIDEFGSWNEALKAAELELNREIDIGKDRLADEIKRLADELGKTPSEFDMNEYGKFVTRTYRSNFGSWNEALKAAGFEPVIECPIEPQWADDVEDYFGKSWPQKRAETVERDDYECQVCGDGGSLNVHHITPRRMFEYPDDSNTLDNLVTLCASCHGNFEGHWADADVETFVEKARGAYGVTEESGVQTELREPILV